jgi:hypothetical protein
MASVATLKFFFMPSVTSNIVPFITRPRDVNSDFTVFFIMPAPDLICPKLLPAVVVSSLRLLPIPPKKLAKRPLSSRKRPTDMMAVWTTPGSSENAVSMLPIWVVSATIGP